MTHHCDTRFAHIPAIRPLCLIALVLGAWFSTNVLMHAMHWAAPTVWTAPVAYNMNAPHCLTPYPAHSTHPGVVLLCLLVVSTFITHLKGHLVICLFTNLLLQFRMALFSILFSDLLVFPHLRGSLGNSSFVHCSIFCEFLDFLHLPEILVLVGFCIVLSAGLADKHLHSAPSLVGGLFLLLPHTTVSPTQPHPTTS